MLDLIIIGAGGFGRELLSMLEDVFDPQHYRFKGFLAQDPDALSKFGVQAPVLADPEIGSNGPS